jgi:hypothetical protein
VVALATIKPSRTGEKPPGLTTAIASECPLYSGKRTNSGHLGVRFAA